MKILFVGLTNSIHSARWINQLSDFSWDIHFFSSCDGRIHEQLRNIAVYGSFINGNKSQGLRIHGKWPFSRGSGVARRVTAVCFPSIGRKSYQLAKIIQKTRPDVIHSLGLQHGGYLTLAAKQYLGNEFPSWIVSTWGNDLYIFSQLQDHLSQIKNVLTECDYILPDCLRDQALAYQLGFQGEVLSPLPVFGAIDVQ